MLAIAISSADPALRRSLEQLPRGDPAILVVGVADDPAALLRLIEQRQVDVVLVDVVLADAPWHARLAEWRMHHERTAVVVLVDGTEPEDGIEALHAGADAILPRAAGRDEIIAAIKALGSGLAVLPRTVLAALIAGTSLIDEAAAGNDATDALLTPRELEVLAAMADGASNKAIARRLQISFHTAKFHVAAILAKLDADSRTEAVTRAAQLGLVML
jgi:DNA-binding NarL/FixJ family response regulator